MDIFTEAVQHTFLKLVILAFLRAHIRYGGSDKRDFDGMGFYDKTEVAKHRKFTKLLEKTLGNNLSYASVMRVVKPQFPEENYSKFYLLIKFIDKIGKEENLGSNKNKENIIHDIIHNSYNALRDERPLLKDLINTLKEELYKRNKEICAHPEKFEPKKPYKEVSEVGEKPDFLTVTLMQTPSSSALSSSSDMSIDLNRTASIVSRSASASSGFSSMPSPSSTDGNEFKRDDPQLVNIKYYVEISTLSKINFLEYLRYFNSLSLIERDKISDALLKGGNQFPEAHVFNKYIQICAWTLLEWVQRMNSVRSVESVVVRFMQSLPVQLEVDQRLWFVEKVLEAMQESSKDLKKYLLDTSLLHSSMSIQGLPLKDLETMVLSSIEGLKKYKKKLDDDRLTISERHT
ncbi:MAG: hypothetical protein ACD_44C00111G0008 [uncultured bacterium]|nr:MAG: hypothetical protein ACD_44C00111G0008 [uncultured bacterium]OGT15615.1 MAG: hypothetical protein A3B69_03555 [Gammaproteobacteria bacterium RIFCSPHIGHO2_02_FULL_38_33]OGT23448.1 MAG: hypothetical protein A2W47_03640 [Gammaproteobacteria bacterium RIFCSPHIGHO2_12_38_15]OGT68304.1 MAG: hypothetical protein A3I12_06665 [Gammaproteobacteria bacterium RIFCSPLOWO2_02_FULL_38_11]OGT77524.1 MAG: hypothetical protein A3G71_00630 [Gammaproteobacteria bacterium RIFCSPLOWO2_12_FULL_38_14]